VKDVAVRGGDIVAGRRHRCGEMRTIIGLMMERVAPSEAKLTMGGSSGEDGN
jgi:hypothetical protein